MFCLLFADDIALISTTPKGLQCQLDSLSISSHHLGLNVNRKKTKVIMIKKGGFFVEGERWTIDGQKLEVVNQYKLLGFVFTTKLALSKALDNQVVGARERCIC